MTANLVIRMATTCDKSESESGVHIFFLRTNYLKTYKVSRVKKLKHVKNIWLLGR